ncbi:MAG: 6-carboxytetrahydropterin synthase [Rickettsiales bacterium]|jgi:6-pyruvoyltetrahydropterin/6-carboxytetrahydropterin synthase|nr:6-carboxytetrahydropterin synthase [Rickettsiales bacterium]
MYYIKKTLEISASHRVTIGQDGECEDPHGHNWIIVVYCKSENLTENGMVVDFNDIKRIVRSKLDHKNLNEVLAFNPTAENIAKWVVDNVPHCYRATVQETRDNEASYEL